MAMAPAYRGRFAPSPTGPLHLGSLLVAVASYLQARRQGGTWLLRMEDVDRQRCRPHFADAILRDLERLGFQWDETVWYQSRRGAAYEDALARLRAAGLLYACRCSRKHWLARARRGPCGPVYPGTCREAGLEDGPGRALRLRVPALEETVEDPVQGRLSQVLATTVGDFVLRRADGLFAYQLAVVVDDAAQGITEIVRGADLWDNTPRQRYLARCLGLPAPATVHLPVLVDAQGRKLSKRDGAAALDPRRPGAQLVQVLRWLGQAPPAALARAPVTEIWDWACAHWDLARVPRRAALAVPGANSGTP